MSVNKRNSGKGETNLFKKIFLKFLLNSEAAIHSKEKRRMVVFFLKKIAHYIRKTEIEKLCQ